MFKCMKKGLTGISLILVLLGMTVFVGTSFKRTITVTVEVPYMETVPYLVEVEKWKMEPYQVQVPYIENVTVTRMDTVYENSSVLEYNGLLTYAVELKEGPVLVEWSSVKEIKYFALVESERWGVIWSDFQWKYGTVLSIVLMTGGILFPLACHYFDEYIENCTEYVITSEDYYTQNSAEGQAYRELAGGSYNVVVYNVLSSDNETKNSYHVAVSSLYNATEPRTLYREETMYRNVTYLVNETRYHVEEGMRLEEREEIQHPLDLPEGWGKLSGVFIVLGVLTFVYAKKR